MSSPLENFLNNTQWFVLVLLYSWSKWVQFLVPTSISLLFALVLYTYYARTLPSILDLNTLIWSHVGFGMCIEYKHMHIEKVRADQNGSNMIKCLWREKLEACCVPNLRLREGTSWFLPLKCPHYLWFDRCKQNIGIMST